MIHNISMNIKFTKVSGPFRSQSVLLDGSVVGIIRQQGRFYILSSKDGSTFETEGMKYSYAKMFRTRSAAQAEAQSHWIS